MPIKIIGDSISLLNLLITFFALVCGAFVIFALVRRGVLDTLKAVNEAQEIANEGLKRQLSDLKEAYAVQEGRILQIEIDDERKHRQLEYTQQENDLLEEAIALSVPHLANGAADAVLAKLDELKHLRRKHSAAMEEWERAQMAQVVWQQKKQRAHGAGREAAP